MGARIVLFLDAALFMAFGLLYVVIPEQMAAKVGIQMNTLGAVIDLQGLYGGLELGLGTYLGYCALKASRHRTGLLAGSFALSGIALVRLIGVLKAGVPELSVALLIGLDFLGAFLNIALFRFQPRKTKHHE